MPGYKDIQNTPNRNTNGLDKNPQNINTKGSNPSIKNQLKEILNANGELLIEKKDVVKINKDGSVILKVPTQMQIALRLKQLAMGKADNTTIKAIQMIMEQFDGKPRQMIGFEIQDIKPLQTIRLPAREK